MIDSYLINIQDNFFLKKYNKATLPNLIWNTKYFKNIYVYIIISKKKKEKKNAI